MPLNGSHIAFITDDLYKKGLVYEPLKEELIDHICCSVEHEMSKNIRFREAYEIVIQKQFKPSELNKIQSKTLYEINQKPKIMVRNYIKTAYRNLVKHKFYSLINITGLAVGITSCLLILLFVQDELSYDQHHEKADRIYRISADIKFGGNHMLMNVAPAPMAETMVIDYPDVETAGRFRLLGSGYLIKEKDQNVLEENVVFADKQILDIFTIPFIYGDPTTALEKPNTLIMSESASKRTFGDENPVGKQVTLNNEDLYEVVGVYQDMPANSHFHLDLMLSMEGLDHAKSTVWLSNNYQTYFLLREGVIGEDFESKLVKKGKIQPRFLPVLRELVNVKRKLKAGKLNAKEVDRAKKDTIELVDSLVEYAQRVDLVSSERGTMQISYKGKKAELLLLGEKNFLVEGKIIRKIEKGKLVGSDKNELEESLKEYKGKLSTSVPGNVFSVLKKELGDFEIVL